MKYVPILPHGAEQEVVKLMGVTRLFCFADLAHKHERLARFYRNVWQQVLMDHPVYELQPALDLEDTLAVMKLVQPDITTVPDVHEDYSTTMDMFFQYAPVMKEQFPHIQRMGVPQGKSFEQILISAYAMADSGLCDMLAIGIKRSIPDLDRAALVSDLHLKYPHLTFHLLGARWPYTNEHSMAHWPWVESLDSAEPISAALRGIDMQSTAVVPADVARDERFNTGKLAQYVEPHLPIIKRNVKWMQSILATPEVSSEQDRLSLV